MQGGTRGKKQDQAGKTGLKGSQDGSQTHTQESKPGSRQEHGQEQDWGHTQVTNGANRRIVKSKPESCMAEQEKQSS